MEGTVIFFHHKDTAVAKGNQKFQPLQTDGFNHGQIFGSLELVDEITQEKQFVLFHYKYLLKDENR